MADLLSTLFPVHSTAGTVGGATTVTGPVVDMRGAEGCLFVISGSSLFTPTTTATMAIRIMGGTSGSTGDMLDIGTTGGVLTQADAVTHVINSQDNKLTLIDVYRPLKPYIAPAIDNSSGGMNVTALKYGLRRKGSTEAVDSTTILGSTTLIGGATS